MLRRRQVLGAMSIGLLADALSAGKFDASDVVVNVRDFGATGDGETDDSAAVGRALRSEFRTFRFPPGRYLLSDIALGAKNVFIDASEATYINAGDGTAMFRVAPSARLARSRLAVGDYWTGDRGGVFLDISGGLVVDSLIDIDRVHITSPAGGVIRHHSGKDKKRSHGGTLFHHLHRDALG